MNDFLFALLRAMLVLAALVAGAFFFVFFFMLALAVGLVWGVRRLWARVTGRPVSPWIFKFDPRAGFRRGYSGVWESASKAQTSRQNAHGGRIATDADVTDVTPKTTPSQSH